MNREPTHSERFCLRQLATWVAKIAALPDHVEKRRAVMALNRLAPVPVHDEPPMRERGDIDTLRTPPQLMLFTETEGGRT